MFNRKSKKSTEQDFTVMVYCTLQMEGLHSWPDCPIEEVDYLRFPHRHMFHITACSKVQHDDRDQEFIVLKHKIQEHLRTKYYYPNIGMCDFGARSCEEIGRELMNRFKLTQVEVSEDDENGAILVR